MGTMLQLAEGRWFTLVERTYESLTKVGSHPLKGTPCGRPALRAGRKNIILVIMREMLIEAVHNYDIVT